MIPSLLSAVLFASAFPPFNLAEAAYVFAIPLILWALFGRPAKSEGKAIFISGWLAWIVLLWWLRNATESLDMPLTGAFGLFLTGALALILAIFWWAWAWLAVVTTRWARYRSLNSRLAVMIGMAAAWVILEWLRAWIFTGFPWLPLSASQWQRPLLLQIASITGAYGVSFVLIAFNFGLGFYLNILWRNRKEKWLKRLSAEFYLALALLFSAIGFGLHSAGVGFKGSIDGPKLGFVQPNTSVIQKWNADSMRENLDTLSDLTTYASYLDATLILWPEAPTPLPLKGNISMQQWVEDLCSGLGLPILAGNVAREGDPGEPGAEWYNAVFTIDPVTGVNSDNYYAKRHLVPFGEYVPFAQFIPFVDKFVPVDASFLEGDSVRLLEFTSERGSIGRIGNLICYEDIFPELARKNVLAGADWHYVATNNVWFGEEAGAWQHAAHSVLRAVETRRPVVRCGNAGWSGWIDEFGHIRHTVLDNTGSIYFQGVEAVDFRRNRYWAGRTSLYVAHGDWFVALCGGLIPLVFLFGRFGWSRLV